MANSKKRAVQLNFQLIKAAAKCKLWKLDVKNIYRSYITGHIIVGMSKLSGLAMVTNT